MLWVLNQPPSPMSNQVRKFVNSTLQCIKNWLNTNNIGVTEAKRLSIAKEMWWVVYDTGLTESDLLGIQTQIRDTPFRFGEGNLWKHISSYFKGDKKKVEFCQQISLLTPSGLNTSPNACCGKYELLYRLFRPLSRQPKRGDICDDGEIIELKGSEVRVQDTLLGGVSYIENTNQLFKKYGYQGNRTRAVKYRGQEVFEIEKPQHYDHYRVQFETDIEKTRRVLGEYFKMHQWKVTIDEIVKDGKWNQEGMQRAILSNMFEKYQTKSGFDKMLIFGDGNNVKLISGVNDLDKVRIYDNYFRIAQTEKVGWYIS